MVRYPCPAWKFKSALNARGEEFLNLRPLPCPFRAAHLIANPALPGVDSKLASSAYTAQDEHFSDSYRLAIHYPYSIETLATRYRSNIQRLVASYPIASE
jgi:chromosome condensin MukBEF MukE localization factor